MCDVINECPRRNKARKCPFKISYRDNKEFFNCGCRYEFQYSNSACADADAKFGKSLQILLQINADFGKFLHNILSFGVSYQCCFKYLMINTVSHCVW